MLETVPKGLNSRSVSIKSLSDEQAKLQIVISELNAKLNKVEGTTAELSNQLSELINN